MELHIYNALKKYAGRRQMRFHMPGHKGNRRRFGRLFRDAKMDITELSFSDCLENADGVIAQAQRDVADALGAKKSYFLTDGSSCGVYALVFAARGFGGKILISRNSHKSVYNACAVLGLEPVIVQNNESNGVLLPPNASEIESVLKREGDIGAVLLTSPDYYGNIADYAAIRKICDRYGKLLFVDGAHGAYLRFDHDEDAVYAGRFADAWVDGSHKTMPTLTQGALLNIRNEALFSAAEEALDRFRTTSPSYLVLASLEYGVKMMRECGAPLIDAVKREILLVKSKLKKRGISCYQQSKTLVLAVDFASQGILPQTALEALEKRGVFAELADSRYVLFYFSALTAPAAIARLGRKICSVCRMRSLRTAAEEKTVYVSGIKKFSYLTATSLQRELVPLEQAIGRVAAKNAGSTPPCYPVVIAGEQITEEAVQALKKARHTFGLEENAIAVVKIGGK